MVEHREVDEASQARSLLAAASQLLGPGRVLLQICSDPVVEWVFVGDEDGAVVVSDNGETFAEIAGLRGGNGSYRPWSADLAATAAGRFGVQVVDEGGEGYEGFRLRRIVEQDESVGESVQAVARAIDGTRALHTLPGDPQYGSFFWDSEHS